MTVEFQGIKNLPNEPYVDSWIVEEWRDLIQNLVDELNSILPIGGWKVAQIKEKWNGLRFYVDYDFDKITDYQWKEADKAIAAAENRSFDLLED